VVLAAVPAQNRIRIKILELVGGLLQDLPDLRGGEGGVGGEDRAADSRDQPMSPSISASNTAGAWSGCSM
jgi:hypothetical protein